MIKKLIELDAAIDAMAELQGRAASKGELTGISKAWKRIKALPTVDAVEVVRCKDCKWYGYYSCEMGGNNWMRDGNGFCDRGVRKDGDSNG